MQEYSSEEESIERACNVQMIGVSCQQVGIGRVKGRVREREKERHRPREREGERERAREREGVVEKTCNGQLFGM